MDRELRAGPDEREARRRMALPHTGDRVQQNLDPLVGAPLAEEHDQRFGLARAASQRISLVR
jgi:hypothetical protein